MSSAHLKRRDVILACGVTLIVVAASIFGWLAFENYGTDYLAKDRHAAAINKLEKQWENGEAPMPSSSASGGAYTSLPGDDASAAEPGQGTPFGLIYVPKFGKDFVAPIIEATSLNQLADGVGHGIGTAMPGQIGNVGIAGHRTTWGHPFRDIDKLVAGDKIEIVLAHDTYTYTVRSHEIVKPDQVDVWAPVPHKPGAKPTKRMLTLNACHPLYSAAERYIVYAEQTGHTTH